MPRERGQVKRRPRKLRAVFPNRGIEAEYRRRLRKMIDEMNNSVVYWLSAAWRSDEPRVTELVEIAQDETPADAIARALRKLTRQWNRKFSELSRKLADWFARSAYTRSDASLRRILRDSGFTVKMQMSPAQRDVLDAAIHENVGLIRSIPRRYFEDVEGLVYRSVQRGGALKEITEAIQERYHKTRNRAALISRDQNNKVTAVLTRVRRLEMGLTEAVWIHSHGGRQPRPSHVKMHGRTFNIAEGMWDPHERKWIQPGELINCRCVSRAVIPGMTA